MFPTAPILCSLVHYSFEVINKSETGTRDAIMPPIVLKCPPRCVHSSSGTLHHMDKLACILELQTKVEQRFSKTCVLITNKGSRSIVS